ncbi:MAG: hypothetical protein M0009_05105 [Deltaproteobacteria bacterium]|nr:hypothetical protein [Deltaproteobacteria bacterium]
MDENALSKETSQQAETYPRRWTGVLVCLGLLLFLAGCGAPKLYNIDMRYEPTKTIRPAPNDGRKYSLTVTPFIDERKIADTVLIGRVIERDGAPIPILPKYVKPTDAVAAALRSLLTQAGYAVAPDKPVWDLKEASIQPAWGTLLVGGTIDELDVTCLDNLTMKRYTAKARVTLVFADVQKKRIFYKITSESSSSLDHIVFSEEKLQSQINGVLSDAMEKAVEGPEVGRRITEALRQP